jgi:tetratricopeptide (TPR) repeat protein
MNQAERYFRKAVGKDPEFARAWVGLGVVAEHFQRPLEGIHCIRKAIEIEDKNPEYWYFMAGFQDEAGLGEEADLSYRQSLMLEPNLWECRLDYSDFLAQHGHLQEAIDTLLEGIQIDPGRTSLIYRYGALLLEAGRRKSGLEVLEQALAQDFDLHAELLEYNPLLERDSELNRLIDRYRP